MAFDGAWYKERIMLIIIANTSIFLIETVLNTFMYQVI